MDGVSVLLCFQQSIIVFQKNLQIAVSRVKTLSVFSHQDVYDKVDYLSSLGKSQTAAVQRDADIGVAEAERDAGIRVS